MGTYDLGKLKEVSGDGVSGLASRSELAIARALAKYQLGIEWFREKSQDQNDLCADCGKPEKARIAGGAKRKPLGLGFENGVPNRLICMNCAASQRKKRIEEKNAPKDHDSFELFWQANRSQLEKEDPIAYATLRERDADVREIYEILGIYLRSEMKPCYQLTDTLDEIEQELITQGTTDLDQLSAPFYKVEHRRVFDEIQACADLPEAPRHARNAAVFARYGWLQALPVSAGDHVVREFLRKGGRWPYPDWGEALNPIRTVKCSTYQCRGEFQYNVNTDPIPPAQWWCEKCRAEERTRHDKRIGRTLAEVAPDRPYFVGGRLTTADTSNAAWFAKLPGA